MKQFGMEFFFWRRSPYDDDYDDDADDDGYDNAGANKLEIILIKKKNNEEFNLFGWFT